MIIALIRSRRRKAFQRFEADRDRYYSELHDWKSKIPEGRICDTRAIFNSGPYAGQKLLDVMEKLGYPHPQPPKPSESDERIFNLYYRD